MRETTDANEAEWYYHLGGRTLGPVRWSVIADLARDTVDPDHLLVARGGDAQWHSVSETVAAHPELEPPDAAAGAHVDRSDEEAKESAPLTPGHGLGRWTRQGATIVSGALGSFILAQLAVTLLDSVTLGLGSAPVAAGIYIMVLRRFRGKPISLRTMLKGFRFVLPALVIAVVVRLGPLALHYAAWYLVGLETVRSSLGDVVSGWVPFAVYMIVSMPIAAAAFYAMPLVVDRGMGGWEAVLASWKHTRERFLSYLGMTLVLALLSWSGALLLGIGTLVTAPVALAAKGCAYVFYFHRIDEAKGGRV